MPAPRNNKNAQKPIKRSAYLHLRVLETQKQELLDRAKERGKTLTEYILEELKV